MAEVLVVINRESFRGAELAAVLTALDEAKIEFHLASEFRGSVLIESGEIMVNKSLDEIELENYRVLVLVGDFDETSFGKLEKLKALLVEAKDGGKLLAAIGAAARFLIEARFLVGKQVAMIPFDQGIIEESGAFLAPARIVFDWPYLTASANDSTLIDFSERLVEAAKSE